MTPSLSGSRGKCHQQSLLEVSPHLEGDSSPTLICGKTSQYLSSELKFSGESDWLVRVSLARRSHRLAPRKHQNQTKPPFFNLDFSEMQPCSSEHGLGLHQTRLSGRLRVPLLDLPCSTIIHLPVGYLVDVTIKMLGGGSELEEAESDDGVGEVRQGERGSKCQQWVEMEEEGLPESTARYERKFSLFEKHFLHDHDSDHL